MGTGVSVFVVNSVNYLNPRVKRLYSPTKAWALGKQS